MKVCNLRILPRLGLALVPWMAGEVANVWFNGCFFSESPFCIYYFHPPVMDVLFGLLVLAPFIVSTRLLPLRVLALVILSIFVHAAAVSLLVSTRGSVTLPGVDSIFLNVVPIAIVSSVLVASVTTVISGRRLSFRLGVCSAMAGIPVSATLLLVDTDSMPLWLSYGVNWHWAVWHLSMCAAIYYAPHTLSCRRSRGHFSSKRH